MGPQPPPGINRLALAHPSHGDHKRARRNMVGHLRSRLRARKWSLVTSTQSYGPKQTIGLSLVSRGGKICSDPFLGRATKSHAKGMKAGKGK